LSIFKEGDIIFPLPQAKVILEIKGGHLDYQKVVAPLLDELIDECEEMSKVSDLPREADRSYWNEFILDCYVAKPLKVNGV
jgi:hypothetical protein